MLETLLHAHREDFDAIFYDYFNSDVIKLSHPLCDEFRNDPRFANGNVSIIKVMLKDGRSYEGLIDALMSHIVAYTAMDGEPEDVKTRMAKEQFIRYEGLNWGTDFEEFSRMREVGEFLLFFLTESVLGYPMIVSKMKYGKMDNTQTPVLGSDGIHLGIGNDGTLKIYLGEAKITKSLANAKRDARDSMNTTLDPASLLAKDINILGRTKSDWNIGGDEQLKIAIEAIVNPYYYRRFEPIDFDFNVVCLLGYECENYKLHIDDPENPAYHDYVKDQIKNIFGYFQNGTGLGDRKIEFFLLPLFDHKMLIRSFQIELNHV